MKSLSHPSWVCGLKQSEKLAGFAGDLCHTLRGCVD